MMLGPFARRAGQSAEHEADKETATVAEENRGGMKLKRRNKYRAR